MSYDIYKYRPEEDNPAGIIFSENTNTFGGKKKSKLI